MSPRKKQNDGAAGAEVTFEEALERLEALVDRLEEGEIPLEESVQAYAEGMGLVKQCLEKLAKAETTIRELRESEGDLGLFPTELADNPAGGDEEA